MYTYVLAKRVEYISATEIKAFVYRINFVGFMYDIVVVSESLKAGHIDCRARVAVFVYMLKNC